MSEISELTKDPEWQKVRRSLVGQWSKRPEWCCKQLRLYLGPIKTTTNEKIKIIMNYLTGTGFRTGKIKHKCIDNLRTQLSIEIKRRKAKNMWQ